jgi:hypothetical protein
LDQGWDAVMGALRRRYEEIAWANRPSLPSPARC